MAKHFLLLTFFALLLSSSPVNAQRYECGTDVHGSLGIISRSVWQDNQHATDNVQATDGLRVVRLAVEADTKFFNENGGTVESAKTYIQKLVNATSRVFERELGVRLQIVWTKVWTNTEPDPYQINGDGVALGTPALAYWKANTTVDRDAVLCLTSGGGGGIGYQFTADDGGGLSSLCTSSALAAASPFAGTPLPDANFTYSVYIIAHELGHVLGAVHSHNCFWAPALDTCTVRNDPQFASGDACLETPAKPKPNDGSIMSYCGGINNASGLGYTLRMTFLEKIQSYLAGQLQSLDCKLAPSTPMLVLLSPQDGKAEVGKPLTIRWRSYDVPTMFIQWKKVGEQDWQTLTHGAFGTLDSWSWTPPVEPCAYDAVIRIISDGDSTIADTSDIPIHIEAAPGACLLASLDFKDILITSCAVPEAGYGGMAAVDRNHQPQQAWSMDDSNPFVYPNLLGPGRQGTYILWFSTSRTTGVQHLVGTNWEQGATASVFVWEGTLGSAVWSVNTSAPIQAWGPTITPNQWYQVALVFTTEMQQLFVNGELTSFKPLHSPPASHVASVFIGKRGQLAEPFYGSVDAVRILSCAISADSIKALYEEEKPRGPDDVAEATDLHLPTISFDGTTLTINAADGEQPNVLVYDLLGQVYLESQQKIVSLQNIPNGGYFVAVKTRHGFSTKAIVISN